MRTILVATGLLALALSACAQATDRVSESARSAAQEAAASANAAAAEAQKAVDTLRATTAEHCQGESNAAERTMKARQTGVAMATMMTLATKYGEPYIGFVKAAYQTPRLSTEDAKDTVIGEFRDHAYSQCLARWDF